MVEAHYSTTIETIANRNFGNNFHKQNGPKHNENSHKHTRQQYQSISFQISSNLSHTHLKRRLS